jgi:putative sterol carrier protein
VASAAECEQALHALAARMAENPGRGGPNRSLTCTLRDLSVTFAGKLESGQLTDIQQSDGDGKRGQIALTMTSDDLLEMVAGDLNVASAWASGRVKIDASPMDLIRLRSIF